MMNHHPKNVSELGKQTIMPDGLKAFLLTLAVSNPKPDG